MKETLIIAGYQGSDSIHTKSVEYFIDELSSEQKSTIKNVVSSFKLADGNTNVQFGGYVIRLVQKINLLDNQSGYALTVQ